MRRHVRLMAGVPVVALLMSGAPSGNTTLTVDQFVAMARETRIEASVDAARIEAARGRQRGAGWLPDPMVEVMREGIGAMSGTTTTVRLTQSIPWPTALTRDTRANEIDRRQRENAAARDALLRDAEIGDLYWSIVAKNAEREIARRDASDAKRLAKVAETRVARGLGSLRESRVLRAEAALAESRSRDADADFDSLREIAALWTRRTATELRFPGECAVKPSSGDAKAGEVPDYAREDINLSMERRMAEISRRRGETLPRLSVGGELMREDRAGAMPMYNAMVGVSVPIWSFGVRSGLSIEESAVDRERADRVEYQERAREAALRWNSRRGERLTHHLRVIDADLLPAARGLMESTSASYAAGRADFLSVNSARANLYATELGRVTACRDYWASVTERSRVRAGVIAGEWGRMTESISAPGSAGMGAGSSMTSMGAAGSASRKGTSSSAAGASPGIVPGDGTDDSTQTPSGGMGGMGNM